MKTIYLILFSAVIFSSCAVSRGENKKNQTSADNPPTFNQKLAETLGADAYGMKNYMIVMLTTGSANIEDKAKKAELMKGHMQNIGKLAKEGKLVLAGPFLENNSENYRGMFIFNTKLKDDAENWVKTDPAVSAGIFEYKIFSWYGSAALPKYLDYHKEIARENP